jgi:anion-transporting  ArsA/GET3 family ATPase
VYEYVQERRFGLIVVDTPPAKHALDFLEVPERLVKVFDSGTVQFLFKPTRLLRFAGGKATSIVARWTSQEYLEAVADFFVQFDQMFLDMEKRVRGMRAILTDPSQTGIVIVATPEPASLAVAQAFHRELTGRMSMPVDAVVVNRVLADPPRDTGIVGQDMESLLEGAVRRSLPGARGAEAEVARGLVRGSELYRGLAAMQQELLKDFRQHVPCEIVQVPALPRAVASLEGLEAIRASMFGPPPQPRA